MNYEQYWLNKKILITGASRGLGRALALESARLGAQVIAVARASAELSELGAMPRIHTIAADVSAKDEVYRIAGEAIGVLGGIDVLINNASYLGATPLRLLLDSDCEDLSQAFETNVLGPFRLIKALVPNMVLSNSGLVVNISSDAAVNAYPEWGGYSASKAALDQLTRILAVELTGKQVRCLAIDPGDMATAMHKAAIPDANLAELYQPTAVASDLLAFLALADPGDAVRFRADAWRAELGLMRKEVRHD